jgi:hypothetical protein
MEMPAIVAWARFFKASVIPCDAWRPGCSEAL